MRKLIAWNVATLDGYFETAPWTLDFHETIWGKDLEALSIQQLEQMDLLLFGRRTYEGMASYWSTETGTIADHMNAMPKLVASRSLKSADWTNTRIIGADLVAEIKALKANGDRPIYVFGSADLLDDLLASRLVDEYRIGIAPVVLGQGTPLFKPSRPRLDLDLLEARPLDTGGILARYAPRWTQ